MTRKQKGNIWTRWIKAYLECLREQREVELITIQVREHQLQLFN
jgi:hypothetical protein